MLSTNRASTSTATESPQPLSLTSPGTLFSQLNELVQAYILSLMEANQTIAAEDAQRFLKEIAVSFRFHCLTARRDSIYSPENMSDPHFTRAALEQFKSDLSRVIAEKVVLLQELNRQPLTREQQERLAYAQEQLDTLCDGYTEEIQTLKTKLEELHEQFHKKEDSLQAQIAKLSQTNDALTTQIEALQIQQMEATQTAKREAEQLQQLEHQLQETTEQLTLKETALEQLHLENKGATQAEQALQQEKQTLLQENEALQKNIQELQVQQAKGAQETATKGQQLAELSRKLQHSEEQLSSKTAHLAQLQDYTTLSVEKLMLEEENRKLKDHNQLLQNLVRSGQTENQELRAKFSTLQAQIDSACKALESLSISLITNYATKSHLPEKINELIKKIHLFEEGHTNLMEMSNIILWKRPYREEIRDAENKGCLHPYHQEKKKLETLFKEISNLSKDLLREQAQAAEEQTQKEDVNPYLQQLTETLQHFEQLRRALISVIAPAPTTVNMSALSVQPIDPRMSSSQQPVLTSTNGQPTQPPPPLLRNQIDRPIPSRTATLPPPRPTGMADLLHSIRNRNFTLKQVAATTVATTSLSTASSTAIPTSTTSSNIAPSTNSRQLSFLGELQKKQAERQSASTTSGGKTHQVQKKTTPPTTKPDSDLVQQLVGTSPFRQALVAKLGAIHRAVEGNDRNSEWSPETPRNELK